MGLRSLFEWISATANCSAGPIVFSTVVPVSALLPGSAAGASVMPQQSVEISGQVDDSAQQQALAVAITESPQRPTAGAFKASRAIRVDIRAVMVALMIYMITHIHIPR